jgi:magnesium transporter
MKLTPLQRIAVPSSSVLSFLRTQVNVAFESPITKCAGVKRSRCAYTTNIRTPWNTTGTLGDGISTRTTRLPSAASRLQPASLSLPSLPCVPEYSSTARRSLSTSSTNHAWNMFKSKKGKRGLLQPPEAPSNLMEDGSTGGTGFSSSLGRMVRTANELKMRCTELDEHGNVTLVSGEFKKSELIAKVRLAPNNMRNDTS